MTDLLTAVQALTRPTIEHLRQVDDDGKYLGTHTAEQPPLIEQLKAAITPSSNTAAGSASMASTRNLIDGDAMFEHAKMSSAAGDWCRMVRLRSKRDAIQDLEQWYPAFTAANPSEEHIRWYTGELKRWAHVIRKIIDSPKKFEVAYCPVCKNTHWMNQDGDRVPWPIIVEYTVPTDGSTIKPTARCRVIECGATWDSYDAIDELAQELKEAG